MNKIYRKILQYFVLALTCALLLTGCSLISNLSKPSGGIVITFRAKLPDGTSNATEDQLDTVEAIFNTRMTEAGYTGARISKDVNKGMITVEIPYVTETDNPAALLGNVAKLTFVNAAGEEILTGSDIKDASYKYGQTYDDGPSSHYVLVEFTPEAKQKFADATRAAAAQASSGNNYISIKMDETIISNPRVSQEINSDTCIITGDFDAASAKDLASQIKSGSLPFELEIVEEKIISPNQ